MLAAGCDSAVLSFTFCRWGREARSWCHVGRAISYGGVISRLAAFFFVIGKTRASLDSEVDFFRFTIIIPRFIGVPRTSRSVEQSPKY